MNETVKVLNRFLGQTTYVIPELHIRRTFQRGAEQEVPFKELQYLKYQAGGEEMLRNILMIEDEEALEKLVGDVEPEYHYTESDVENLLLNGSLEQLEDALDFAPLGVIELIKEKAVSLKLSDINKRDAIAKKTEFNVTKAIELLADDGKDTVAPAPNARKAAPITHEEETSTAPIRKYNVVG